MLELATKMDLDITVHVDWDTLEATAKVRIFTHCALINNKQTNNKRKENK